MNVAAANKKHYWYPKLLIVVLFFDSDVFQISKLVIQYIGNIIFFLF